MSRIALLLLLSGCVAQVGDSCETSTDCGTELSCEKSLPDGYCTAPFCTVGACPSEATCVTFDDDSRFCMQRCDEASDCRDSYVCVQDFGSIPFCNAAPFIPPPRTSGENG